MKSVKHTVRIGSVFLTVFVLFSAGCKSKEKVKESQGMKVVAMVGGRAITEEELHAKVAAREYQLQREIHRIQSSELNNMVSQIILEMEAKNKEISSQELLNREVTSKVPEVTPEMVNKYYQDNKQYFPKEAKVEDLKAQIARFLKVEKEQAQLAAYMDQLKKTHQVSINLTAPEPPVYHVEIGDAPAEGPKDGVTIVEFSDFQCPFCKRAQDTLFKVKEAYGGKVRFVFKQFPLTFHPQARAAAEASLCAHKEGKFWEYKKLLYEVDPQTFGRETFINLAKKVGVGEEPFKQCLDQGQVRQLVDKDISQGRELGVTGTPAFFVNGRLISGARSFEDFDELIKRGLAETKAR